MANLIQFINVIHCELLLHSYNCTNIVEFFVIFLHKFTWPIIRMLNNCLYLNKFFVNNNIFIASEIWIYSTIKEILTI